MEFLMMSNDKHAASIELRRWAAAAHLHSIEGLPWRKVEFADFLDHGDEGYSVSHQILHPRTATVAILITL